MPIIWEGVIYLKALTIRLEEDQYNQLKNLAASRNNTPLAELAREILANGLAADVLDTQRDIMKEVVRLAVDDALKPSVNRLASIEAKGSIMSATATFLSMLVLNQIGKIEQERVYELYNDARKKAYLFVRESDKSEDDK